KRQADALSTALGIAAAAWDTTGPTPSPTTGPTPAPATGTEDTEGTERAASTAGTGGAASTAGAVASAAESAEDTAGAAGAAGTGGRVAGYGAKATITVTIDFDDLKAATADAVGRTVYSGGLSAATIRRLACDANIIPLVLGSNSEPLDVGRRVRLVTKAMRRAMEVRDRGCVVCGAPPVMCDAHHLISWIDGGHTKVDNLALLCRRHHTDLHRGRWHLTILDGIVRVARPSWAEPSPTFAAARRAAAPHTHPPGGGTGSRESELTEAELGAASEDVAMENVAGRSRWRADVAALQQAADFAAAG
ncbi:HNH endonuclease, partial [Kribbella sp. NPDC003505]|uniref:HNH endonuclease n=1 Tax=Kribbella sp. NPDC003505 TaxID=3154448 RepID=UPI0033B865E1